MSIEELFEKEEEGYSEDFEILDKILSGRTARYLNKYTDLDMDEVGEISLVETYAGIIKKYLGVNAKFIKEYTNLYKEHKISKKREGRREVIRYMGSIYGEEGKESEEKKEKSVRLI
ncbi:MAG: hypothetical protein QXE05_04825 [Nitrososphaeria archaeon]